MKNLKLQRNTWCFAGVCFILGFILHLHAGNSSYLNYTLLGITIIASFINAYNTHKKITTK